MTDLTDLLSGLFSGSTSTPDATASAAAPSAPGVQDSGVKALNNSIATGNILARLKVPGASSASSIGGIAGGGMSAVKPESSKLGAFAQGFGGAMKASADAKAAQQKASVEWLKALWDHQDKAATRQNQADTLAETKRMHDITGGYYKGLIENGARDKTDVVNDAYKTELARTNAANRMGLRDPTLNKTLSDPLALPEQKTAAQAELDRRQKMFDDWDGKQTWSKDGKLPAPGTVPLPALPPQDPNAPATAPAAGDDEDGNNPTPPPATVAPDTQKGGPPGPMSGVTKRPVIGPDGTKYLFNTQTKALEPWDGGQAAIAPPDPTPPPPGLSSPEASLPGFSG